MAVFVEPQPELLHYGIFRLTVLAIYGFDAEHALHLYSFGCGYYGEIASVGELPALRVLYLDSCSAVGALGLALGGGGGVPLVTAVEARCHALCVAYGIVTAATLCWNRVCGLIGRRVIGSGCLALPTASACCNGCGAGLVPRSGRLKWRSDAPPSSPPR